MIDTQPITRRRGDTYRIRVGFTQDDGTPLPLDGTFRLVVTEQSAPTELDAPVMELAGTIVEDGQAGADAILDFQQTIDDADFVGEFYYEVENTTAAGDIRTILEGPFTMTQDRAKGNIGQLWTPDGTDGGEVVMNGSEFWHRADQKAAGELGFKYQTRESVKVMRMSGTEPGDTATLFPLGVEAMRHAINPRGVYDYEFLFYMEGLPGSQFTMDFVYYYDATDRIYPFWVMTNWNGNTLNIYTDTSGPNSPLNSDYYDFAPIGCSNPPNGWIRWKARIDYETLTLSAKNWDADTAEPDWIVTAQQVAPNMFWPPTVPRYSFHNPTAPNILEIASYEWRKIG